MIPALISGLILGIAAGSFVPVTTGFFLAILFITLIIFVYKYSIGIEYRNIVFMFFVFMVGVLFGVGRVWYSDLYSESKLTDYVGQKIEVEGIVVGEPDVRDINTKLTVKLSKPVKEKILVTVPLYPELHYGDKVKMNVTLVEPNKIVNKDGRSFDYGGYLRVRGVWFTSRYTTVELLSSGHGSFVKTLLFKNKNAFIDSINNVLPEPESNLLGGLLLGVKQSLGKDKLLEFQKTGSLTSSFSQVTTLPSWQTV